MALFNQGEEKKKKYECRMGTICSSSDLKRFTTCSPVAPHSDSLWLHFISVLRLFLPPLQAVISSAFYMYIYFFYFCTINYCLHFAPPTSFTGSLPLKISNYCCRLVNFFSHRRRKYKTRHLSRSVSLRELEDVLSTCLCKKRNFPPKKKTKFPCHFFLTFNTRDNFCSDNLKAALFFCR